jgi:nitrate reductase delta subunit
MEKLLEALALALDYPLPGRLETLWRLWIECPRSGPKQKLERFLRQVEDLSLEEWEELYTRTLDLTPTTAPYVGFAVYGESYQRGEFLAALTRAFREEGVDPGSELPDHLANVLRYLARAKNPLPELAEILPQALATMHKTLKTLDAKSPYLLVLEAASEAVAGLVRR